MKARAPAPSPGEPLILARATEIDLSARETAVVFGPAPPQRRPPQKAKLPKGAKPPVPRTLIVLRDVVATDRTPPYDLFLVLEGPNVFQPTTTSQRIGVLELFGRTGYEAGGRPRDRVGKETIAFDVTEAMAKLSKTRGFNMHHLRLSIVRRPVIDASGAEAVPPDPTPPEIGAIELVRS